MRVVLVLLLVFFAFTSVGQKGVDRCVYTFGWHDEAEQYYHPLSYSQQYFSTYWQESNYYIVSDKGGEPYDSAMVLNGETVMVTKIRYKKDTALLGKLFRSGSGLYLAANGQEQLICRFRRQCSITVERGNRLFPSGKYTCIRDTSLRVENRSYDCYKVDISYKKSSESHSMSFDATMFLDKASLLPLFQRRIYINTLTATWQCLQIDCEQ